MAFDIERVLGKDRIFRALREFNLFRRRPVHRPGLNQGYLGKAPGAMNDWESTMLAGTPNAPAYTPPHRELRPSMPAPAAGCSSKW